MENTPPRALLDSDDCLIILNYATRLLSIDLERDILMERALEALSDFSANKNVALLTLKDNERHLRLEGLFKDLHYQAVKEEILYLGTPLEEVIINKEYGIYPNLEGAGFPMPAGKGREGEGCCLCLPLAGTAARIIGVVTIAEPVGNHHSTKELQMLTILATVIAVSLENSNLFAMATRDCLTDLYIRTIFDIRLKEELARLKRNEGVFSILMTDIDTFKSINDNHGHDGGDAVLQELAMIFRKDVRADLDIVCRYGGDEFITLMTDTGAEEAMKIARRIHERCTAHPFLSPGKTLPVTISSGLLTVHDAAKINSKELLKKVDRLLYQAKRQGKNQISSGVC